jgi:hypothetical protein
MKKQFLHEHHNRQDKVRKADYLEELRSTPRTNHIPNQHLSTRSPSSARLSYVKHKMKDLAPAVVTGLHRLDPAIDIDRVKQAVNSMLGEHKITASIRSVVRGGRISITAHAKADALHKALKAMGRTVPGRFYQWHEKAKFMTESDTTFECEIPAEFHQWLLKFKPKSLTLKGVLLRSEAEPATTPLN